MAQFKVIQRTYRGSKLHERGEKFVCRDEDVHIHAGSAALKPRDAHTQKLVDKALAAKAAEKKAEPATLEEAKAKIAALEAQLKAKAEPEPDPEPGPEADLDEAAVDEEDGEPTGNEEPELASDDAPEPEPEAEEPPAEETKPRKGRRK